MSAYYFQILGIKEGGVDAAIDNNNKALISADVPAAVEKTKTGLVDGSVPSTTT